MTGKEDNQQERNQSETARESTTRMNENEIDRKNYKTKERMRERLWQSTKQSFISIIAINDTTGGCPEDDGAVSTLMGVQSNVITSQSAWQHRCRSDDLSGYLISFATSRAALLC